MVWLAELGLIYCLCISLPLQYMNTVFEQRFENKLVLQQKQKCDKWNVEQEF